MGAGGGYVASARSSAGLLDVPPKGGFVSVSLSRVVVSVSVSLLGLSLSRSLSRSVRVLRGGASAGTSAGTLRV